MKKRAKKRMDELVTSTAVSPLGLEPEPSWIWRWPDIAAIVGVIIALLAIGLPLITWLWGPDVSDTAVLDTDTLDISLAFSLAATTLQVVAFGVGVGLVMVVRRIPTTAVLLNPMSQKWWLNSFALGLLCIPLTGYIAYGYQTLFYDEISNPQLDFVLPEGFSWTALIGMTLLVGFAIPFVEELFFRGVLFGWLRQKWPFWAAALLSSAVFALLHGEPSIIAGTVVLGLLAAWAVEKSGSLWSAVVIHLLNNAVKVLALYLMLLV